MFRLPLLIALPLLLAVTGDGVAGTSTLPQPGPDDDDATATGAPSGALACSLAARERYIEDARAAGITVEGEGDDVDVIATSEAQKTVLEGLYKMQLADLGACQESPSDG
ncbi:MAG: hypothetical protein AAF317_14570 [Pseudomonadota bacterium]